MKKTLVSLVVTIYNEEESLYAFYRAVEEMRLKLPQRYDLEYVFVNDGSKDQSLAIIKELSQADMAVSYVDFSRNFGHEAAVQAGLDHCNGAVAVILDADLQDPPELILQMLEAYEQGYDVVNAKRATREGETYLKKATAKLFYRLINKLTKPISMPENVGNFRLISRRVIDALATFPERTRFFRGLVNIVGFPTTEIEFLRPQRYAGETKYNYWKMWNYALEGITSLSTFPLKLATYVGSTFSLIGIVLLGWTLWSYAYAMATGGTIAAGWTSMMAVNLFFFGLVLVILGVIGEYISRIFIEIKQRPLYIVREYRKMGQRMQREEENDYEAIQ